MKRYKNAAVGRDPMVVVLREIGRKNKKVVSSRKTYISVLKCRQIDEHDVGTP